MKKIFFTLIFTIAYAGFLFAQGGITNKGAVITVSSGTYVVVDNNGGYFNETDGSNHGQINLDGTFQIEGNFENNVTDASQHVFTNVGTDGEVIFAGSGTQHILNATDNAYIDFEKVTVNSGSTTLLDAGSAASVNGVLNVAGTFRLSSPADGEGASGSLITNTAASGNVTGTGALWVDRHFETSYRWQYVSMPVNNATDDFFDNTLNSGSFNPNVYSYDESVEGGDPSNTNYSNWSDLTNYTFYTAWTSVAADGTAVGLSSGVGYITYNERELDVSFGGTPANLNNTGSYSPSVSFTLNDNGNGAGDYYDGWNIVGNPYPCALDWDNANWTKTGITNTVYMWDGDNGNYIYYNDGSPEDHVSGVGQTLNSDADGRYIPAMQSFAIKASSSPTFTIPQEARVHHVKDMYKKGDEEVTDFQYIKLKAEDGNFTDEMIVRFLDNATEAIDDAFDAYKMFPNNPPVMIYSLVTNPETPIAINSLPIENIGTSIPLGFVSTNPGTYTITAEDVVFDAGTDVKLIDTYENKEVNLYNGTEYTFSFDGGEVRDRFYLFYAPSTDIDNPQANDNYIFSSDVWSNQNKVFIAIKSNKMINANVKIVDVLGRIVTDQNVNGTYNIINVPGASGTYFVKLTGANGISQTKKVFIQK